LKEGLIEELKDVKSEGLKEWRIELFKDEKIEKLNSSANIA